MKESAESEKGIDQVKDSKKDKVVADRAVKLMLSKYIFVSKLLRQIKEIPKPSQTSRSLVCSKTTGKS